MRIWDIHPGYLNRQSLLGEHRELHGLLSILTNGKKDYSRHPETLRWVGRERALARRHILLVREMVLRGFTDRTPVELCGGEDRWPETYVDSPDRQFALLADKYAGREQGRIPLPRSVQQLWSHHKYSVLARNPEMYRTIGRQAASGEASFSDLSALLVETLRAQPSPGGIRNAAQHMWGHVSGFPPSESVDGWPMHDLLCETQRRARMHGEAYLLSSTALSELSAWLPVCPAGSGKPVFAGNSYE